MISSGQGCPDYTSLPGSPLTIADAALLACLSLECFLFLSSTALGFSEGCLLGASDVAIGEGPFASFLLGGATRRHAGALVGAGGRCWGMCEVASGRLGELASTMYPCTVQPLFKPQCKL
ncbi:hypothetical protein NDU88_001832 [Pleurodeles waltl]|uniref:Uncharacterized protein n=1 Tax=Pleurodeles waltl TaxID=8319 RepID=A0AAV7UWH7_PLEWA|nr:hypothetical protein NDU88_001832 [Pleurodeles waltl]